MRVKIVFLSTGMILGIVIGCILVLLLIVLVVTAIYVKRRQPAWANGLPNVKLPKFNLPLFDKWVGTFRFSGRIEHYNTVDD